MMIEFFCPACGQRVRSPGQTAGRKGRCPQCGLKVQIPDQSLVLDGGPQTPTTVAPVISLICLGCQRTLAVPRSQAGKQGKCPHCGQLSAIPEVPRQISLQFTCPDCQRPVCVPESAAGRQGKCPHCQLLMMIPSLPLSS